MLIGLCRKRAVSGFDMLLRLGCRMTQAPALLLLNAADTQVRFVLPAAEPDQFMVLRDRHLP
jgi:hypothetical protein